MSRECIQEYELDCIRAAAGRPLAEVREAAPPGSHRSHTFFLDGPEGGSFVKCLHSGCQNESGILLSLDHEAEGYRFFAGWEDKDLSLPRVHFYESFPGATGGELQVLGVTNLEAQGTLKSLGDIYLSPTIPVEVKEKIAGISGRATARLVSTGFQGDLDRAAGVAAVRRQTDRVLNHPQREGLLAAVENHRRLPWAYQNKVMGEINVLVPRWIDLARRNAAPQLNRMLDQILNTLKDRELIGALAPGQSSDRIIFSPRDRHVGNTLCVLDGDEIRQLYEVGLEFWGLETGGRLIGRYVAGWQMVMANSLSDCRPADRFAWDAASRNFSRLAGAFCYHFIRGDGTDSPELVLRAVSVGLAGFHAAVACLYSAALDAPDRPVLVTGALDLLRAPDRFLALAADFGSRQSGKKDLVMDSMEQVREALGPLIELATRSLQVGRQSI